MLGGGLFLCEVIFMSNAKLTQKWTYKLKELAQAIQNLEEDKAYVAGDIAEIKRPLAAIGNECDQKGDNIDQIVHKLAEAIELLDMVMGDKNTDPAKNKELECLEEAYDCVTDAKAMM